MSGHGVIVNLSNFLPFTFIFNPQEIESQKKINYFIAPNIGGAYHEKFFTGFENREVSLTLVVIDMENPLGVKNEIAYFEALRNPAPGLMGMASSLLGNKNYPPPQIWFQFGVSDVPLAWDVSNVSIKSDLFHSGNTRGLIGIPKRATISLTLSLDEGSILYKVQEIAEKAKTVAGSLGSIKKELLHKIKGNRKEASGMFNANKYRGQ